MSVALVIVSHSAALARGVVELAGQMAPDVTLVAAGGHDNEGLGTSFDRIDAALKQADSADGVLILYDLGSALLTTETVVEFADPDLAARVDVVNAPLVEGAVAAAVSAQSGADLAAVSAAARGASAYFAGASADDSHPAASASDEVPRSDEATGRVVLVNPLGLHARPAAQLAEAISESHSAYIGRVGEAKVDADSALAIMSLGTRGGEELEVSVTGPDAGAELSKIITLIGEGFGEASDGT